MKHKSLWILILFPGILLLPTFVLCQHENRASKLLRKLFGPNYSPKIIPLCEGVERVNVRIDLAIRELVELNEKYQLIRLKIWVRLKWNDCTLRWNASEFNGMDSIIVPYNTIWAPDITLYEGSSDEENMPGKTEYFAQINSDGNVIYNFPSIITSACRIDVTFFPYDYQNCSLTFGSWIYHGDLIDLTPAQPYGDRTEFVHHNEWDLLTMEARRHVKHYNCCPEPYPDVTYYINLARFPKFYLLTIFVPCVIISVLSVIGFVLPPVSGDKIAIQITVLLSIVVFLLLVQDKLPSSSDTFPYLGVYFMTAMCLVSFSCTMSGIIMYVYYRHRTNSRVPSCFRKLFLVYVRRLLCVSLRTAEEYHVNEGVIVKDIKTLDGKSLQNGECAKLHRGRESIRKDSVVETSANDIPILKDPGIEGVHSVPTPVHVNEWELLAIVLDRLFMILYILLTLINIMSFCIIMGGEMHRL